MLSPHDDFAKQRMVDETTIWNQLETLIGLDGLHIPSYAGIDSESKQ